MEPESLLSCSQEPSTGPYSEPDQSSPYHPILSFYDPSQYYTPTYVLLFLVVSILLAFPSLLVLHALPILSSLT
jgi:hypothetical protein